MKKQKKQQKKSTKKSLKVKHSKLPRSPLLFPEPNNFDYYFNHFQFPYLFTGVIPQYQQMEE